MHFLTDINPARWRHSKQAVDVAVLDMEQSGLRRFDDDAKNIIMENVHFKHGVDGALGFENLNLKLSPGHVYALVGEVGAGRTTLLKLLSRLLVPQTGNVLVPPHYRVVYVSEYPTLVHSTVMHNLRLGLTPADNAAISDEQIWALASDFNLHPYLINSPAFPVGDRGRNLRLADQLKICIIRALLADPDVLVIVKPAEMLPESQRVNVLKKLREWVEQGGLQLIPRHKSRVVQKKTVVVSLVQETPMPEGFVDRVIPMNNQGQLSVTDNDGNPV